MHIKIYHAPGQPHVAVLPDSLDGESRTEAVVNALRRHRRGRGSTPKAFAMKADGKRYTFPKEGAEDWR